MLFAVHPLDEARAFDWLTKLRKRGAPFADAERQVRFYLESQNCDQYHTDEQVGALRRHFAHLGYIEPGCLPKAGANEMTGKSTVKIEYCGKTRQGTYEVKRGLVYVTTANGGHKAAQVGNTSPEALANKRLRELLQEGKA